MTMMFSLLERERRMESQRATENKGEIAKREKGKESVWKRGQYEKREK